MAETNIPWATTVLNPATGCSKVSEGCRFCYAETLAPRLALMGQKAYQDPGNEQDVTVPAFQVRTHPDRLGIPFRWRKPRRIFVGSMTDLFHERIPHQFRAAVFTTMARADWHTYLLLTKRVDVALEFLLEAFRPDTAGFCRDIYEKGWPGNVWFGFTAETQARFEERWALAMEIGLRYGAPLFVSIEPMLEPINLKRCHLGGLHEYDSLTGWETRYHQRRPVGDKYEFNTSRSGGPRLRWVIAGGESAGSPDRRLVDKCPSCKRDGRGGIVVYPPCPECNSTTWKPREWALVAARSLRDQCRDAGVPFFWKQWGGPTPKAGGANLDGELLWQIPRDMVGGNYPNAA